MIVELAFMIFVLSFFLGGCMMAIGVSLVYIFDMIRKCKEILQHGEVVGL